MEWWSLSVKEKERNRIMIGIWMLVTASIPFLQGGYFYVVSIGVSLTYLCLYMYLSVGQTRVTIPVYMMLYMLLFISGMITLTVAKDKGMHLIYMMKLTLPISLWLVSEALVDIIGFRKYRKIWMGIILIWTFGLTLPFIVGAFLTFDFFIQKGRYGGFFQYANSYGAFLCGLFVIWIVPIKTMPIPFKKIRSIAIPLILVAIALTQSRGVYLIAFCLVVIHILMVRKNIVSIGVGILLGWLCLMVLGVGDVGRGAHIHSNHSEWLSRIVYYIDGIKMLRDHPLGIGHLGFYYLQGQYQTAALYQVRYMHQSLLQILLDTGLLGGLGWLSMMLYPLWIGLRQPKYLPFVCGIGLVFAHSLIDFDMQFSAMWVMWYMFMMMLRGEETPSYIVYEFRMRRQWRHLVILIFIAILTYFTVATGLEYEGNDAWALRFYPGYTKAASGLLTDDTNGLVTSEEKKKIALEFTAKKLHLYDGFAFLRKYYYNNGDLEKSIDMARRMVDLKPLHMRNREIYMSRMLEWLLNKEAEGTLSSEHPYFQEIIKMQERLDQLKERKDYKFTIQHEVDLEETPRMQRIVVITQNLYDRVRLE